MADRSLVCRGLPPRGTSESGTGALCFITVDKKPIITFSRWFVDGIDWDSLILVAAVMALGSAMGNPATGIPQFLTNIFASFADRLSLFVFLIFVILILVVQTNIMSNIVSMTITYNIMVPIAIDANIGDPIALGVTIAAASNYAFMLPPATASTALIIGSGWASPRQMARLGAYLIIPVLIIFPFVFYPYASFILK